jgi:hypothetical protein
MDTAVAGLRDFLRWWLAASAGGASLFPSEPFPSVGHFFFFLLIFHFIPRFRLPVFRSRLFCRAGLERTGGRWAVAGHIREGMKPLVSLEKAILDFMAHMRESGLVPPREIIPDENVYRFSASGKARDDAGW